MDKWGNPPVRQMLGRCHIFHALIGSTILLRENRPSQHATETDTSSAESMSTDADKLTQPTANMSQASHAAHPHLD